MKLRQLLLRTLYSVSTKIIIPYLILTLIVAGVGAFVVANLATSSLQERFNNQLLDAGRIVSESLVEFEREQLLQLRTVIFTSGFARALVDQDETVLREIIQSIAINNDDYFISVLGLDGLEIVGWQQVPNNREGMFTTQNEFTNFEDVQFVLSGQSDELGDKRIFLGKLNDELLVLTVGPVYVNDELTGAVIVGEQLDHLTTMLNERSLSRVTFYDVNGHVLASTLSDDFEALQEDPNRYEEIVTLLTESPEQVNAVVATAEDQVPLRQLEVLGQTYRLAYGDWRLRGRSFGMFTAALPSNFIVNAVATSRNLLAAVFSLSTISVLTLGFFIARRIIIPLEHLVDVSAAVVDGDFERRTDIVRSDEIGELAKSFDIMTNYLVTRNREFAAQASNLSTILNSIVDGVVVLDQSANVVRTNAAAQEILNQVHTPAVDSKEPGNNHEYEQLMTLFMADTHGDAMRFEVGRRVYSVLSAPVDNEEQGFLGRVVVLRDITRESEADRVKDSFITGVSHELRTPLTSVKGYINLLRLSAKDNLTPQQQQLVRIADQNADRLIEHVNRIIELAELQSGTLKLNYERLSLSELTKDAAEQWQSRFADKQINFEYRGSADDLWIEGDQPRLAWVLDNLLQNALDYTAPKGHVWLAITKKGKEVCVEVADNGIGIRQADQRYLFTRFFRIEHEPPFDIRGVGLGLFVVQSLIDLHHGSVWVESTYGEGSRFGFIIPLSISA